MNTLLAMAALGVYLGIILLLGWDVWDQIKRFRR